MTLQPMDQIKLGADSHAKGVRLLISFLEIEYMLEFFILVVRLNITL